MKRITNSNINWPLLTKYLTGETSEDEKQMIENWLKEDSKNQQTFEQVKEDLERLDMIKDIHSVNVDKAWSKLRNRIIENENSQVKDTKIKNLPVQKRLVSTTLKWAAVILLVIGFSYPVFKMITIPGWPNSEKVETASAPGSRNNVILADGTTVYLNAGSKLVFPRKFKGAVRKVRLHGEAYFDVKRDAAHPFIIIAENAQVKVLGTAFNVKARKPDNNIEVYVERGSVQLSERNDVQNKVIIDPGYIGMLNKNNQVKKVKNEDVNYMAWKTGRLVFKETPLGEVVKTLDEMYNVNILLEGNGLSALKYNGVIENISLDSVLEALHTAFNLKIENEGKTITIKKNS